MKKDVLKNFTKFTGRTAVLLKKRLWRRCFSKIFSGHLFTEHLWTTASERRYCIDNFVM